MRYQLWDVLLFPNSVNIPLQEFRIACYGTHDPDHGLIPTMTAFIPSLPRGTPFKTSVHCWETPKPSLDAESAKSRGEKVVFGAKAFIDGVCVYTQAIDPYTDWPQLIGDESNGTHQQLLKFPPFHPEILQEAIWDARETLGRIKVVISEGVTKGSGVDDYTPMRNIVCFAFQHAPLEILERTNISWPNTIMWRAVLDPMGTIGNNGAMPLRQYQQQTPTVPRLDTHAHSPRARVHTLASSCYSGHSFLPTASAGPVNNDPFTEEQILRGAPTQNAMPNTGNGNVSGQGNAAEFRLPEDQLVRLLEALSPRSRSRYFTPCEQANQPRSSSTRAADQTPSANGISWESPLPDLTRILRAISTGRQSTASQAAAPAQRSSIRDVLLAAKEGNIPDRKHEREQTDISMHMGCSDYPNCDHDGQRYNDVDNESPAKRVKGKKEGSTSKEKGDRVFIPVATQTPGPSPVALKKPENGKKSEERQDGSVLKTSKNTTNNIIDCQVLAGGLSGVSLDTRKAVS